LRDAASRKLGRLGGDQKNQELSMEFALLAAPETPLFGFAYARCYMSLSFLGFSKNRFFVIKISRAHRYGGTLVVLKIALFSL
jgi:hypothetical protein